MIEYFKLKEACVVNSELPKEEIIANVQGMNYNFDKLKIDRFNALVKTIKILAVLNDETTGIKEFKTSEFDYSEVLVIEIELNYYSEDGDFYMFSNLLGRHMPKPLILLIKYENRYRIIINKARENKKNNRLTVVNEVLITYWVYPDSPSQISKNIISGLNINKYQAANLFELYKSIDDNLRQFKCKRMSLYSKDFTYLLSDIFKLNKEDAEYLIDCIETKCLHEIFRPPVSTRYRDKYNHQKNRNTIAHIFYDCEGVWYILNFHPELEKILRNMRIHNMRGLLDLAYKKRTEYQQENRSYYSHSNGYLNNTDYKNKEGYKKIDHIIELNKTLIEQAIAFETGKNINQNSNRAIEKYLDALKEGFRIIDYVVYPDTMVNLAKNLEYQNKKDESFELLIKASGHGNTRAMLQLGHYYLESETKDAAKAIEYFMKAAEMGDNSAITELAKLYKENIFDIDCINNAKVITEMAAVFADGIIIGQDYEFAFKLFEKAASLDDGEAQYSVGRFYEKGLFVSKNLQKASIWYIKAAEKSNPYALEKLAYFFKEGLAGEKNIQKADEYYKKAAQYFQKRADLNDSEAQYLLGQLYLKGKGVNKNPNMFMELNIKSARNGYKKAQYQYGARYEKENNISMAFEWYKKSAEQNYPLAQYKLGECYLRGKGTYIDEEQALIWFKKAAEQNNMYAQNQLGLYYEDQDEMDEAFKWYLKASENGNFDAMDALAYCYENGYGIKKDLEEAKKWYSEAKKKRNELNNPILG
jgi:TPR repeat protein